MNHKRRRPKDRRAGCLLCKPHKSNGSKGLRGMQTRQEQLAMERDETDEHVALYGPMVSATDMLDDCDDNDSLLFANEGLLLAEVAYLLQFDNVDFDGDLLRVRAPLVVPHGGKDIRVATTADWGSDEPRER